MLFIYASLTMRVSRPRNVANGRNKPLKPSELCDDAPSQTGLCKASIEKWRFMKETKQCESFTYGGCQGTKNLFDSEKDCKNQCLK